MSDLALDKGPMPGKPVAPSRLRDDSDKVRLFRLMRGPTLVGVAVVGLFFGALGFWAATAPLVSGAIAPGVVSPDSNRKAIQHLEGGITQEIFVKENDRVTAGQLLLTLNPVRAEASFSGQRVQWLRLLVTRARLEAEASEAADWTVPGEVTAVQDTGMQAFVAAEQRSFETRQASLNQQQQILGRRVEQLNSEISSVNAENVGLSTQKSLIEEELADKQNLLDQQLVSRSEVNALRRELARLQSAIAANGARIAKAGQSIEETRLQMLQARESYFEEVAQQSSKVNDSIAQLGEGMASTGDALQRTEIRSPVDGTVINLRTQAAGEVVRPGETILEVVPRNDDLIVVAKLAPKNIDLVAVDQSAHVTIIPFASRNTLPLTGKVIAIAPDSKIDEATKQAYYEVRVRIPPEELARHEGMYLSPGMPADVTVVTGERTMMQYLFEPFLKSLQSAFVYD
ncbi:MAG: HlyD family type I secretion periplasmic adaptor subunit [Alphaproteobacteria bacterium]|nr:HlyD family type I secretion periplasmic adaptor subunit [Alphaproteobacteria bacterium]